LNKISHIHKHKITDSQFSDSFWCWEASKTVVNKNNQKEKLRYFSWFNKSLLCGFMPVSGGVCAHLLHSLSSASRKTCSWSLLLLLWRFWMKELLLVFIFIIFHFYTIQLRISSNFSFFWFYFLLYLYLIFQIVGWYKWRDRLFSHSLISVNNIKV